MKSQGQDAPVYVDRRIGLLTGALLGALLRFLVSYLFVFGLDWWSNEIDPATYWLALGSAVIGLFIGGAGGATCKPNQGVIIGGGLSALSCLVYVFVPFELASRMSDKPLDPDGAVRLAFFGGLLAMAIAGALAGGIGAWAGVHSAKRLPHEPQPTLPAERSSGQ
jgi:hypothetical protein